MRTRNVWFGVTLVFVAIEATAGKVIGEENIVVVNSAKELKAISDAIVSGAGNDASRTQGKYWLVRDAVQLTGYPGDGTSKGYDYLDCGYKVFMTMSSWPVSVLPDGVAKGKKVSVVVKLYWRDPHIESAPPVIVQSRPSGVKPGELVPGSYEIYYPSDTEPVIAP